MEKVLNLFPWFKCEKFKLSDAKKVAVVFNAVCHESLVAATCVKTVAETAFRGDDFALVDIRDTLPNVDGYIWIGVGEASSLTGYYELLTPEQRNVVFEKSVFINRYIENQHSLFHDGLIAQAVELCTELFNEVAFEDITRLYRWVVPSLLFDRKDAVEEELAVYAEMVELCYNNYIGMRVGVPVLATTNIVADKEATKVFADKVRAARVAALSRVTTIQYRGSDIILLTVMSNTTHLVLRYLTIAGRRFAHQTHGVYGRVLYSNDTSVPEPEVIRRTREGAVKLQSA